MSKITCRNCGLKQRNPLKLTRLNSCDNCTTKKVKSTKNKPCRLCKNSKGENIIHKGKCPKLSTWGKVGNKKQFNSFKMTWIDAPKAVKQQLIKPAVLPAHIVAHLAALGHTDIETVEEMNKALGIDKKPNKEVI
tara:strand:- start:61 stop:465 length:405 start_codon:yes stop_codon:yes gene_type:complete